MKNGRNFMKIKIFDKLKFKQLFYYDKMFSLKLNIWYWGFFMIIFNR